MFGCIEPFRTPGGFQRLGLVFQVREEQESRREYTFYIASLSAEIPASRRSDRV